MFQYFFSIHNLQVERVRTIHDLISQMTNDFVSSGAKLTSRLPCDSSRKSRKSLNEPWVFDEGEARDAAFEKYSPFSLLLGYKDSVKIGPIILIETVSR
jgi:hypothetical protein